MENSATNRYRPIDGFLSYIQSLDWSEPWLYGLISFYGFLFGGLYLSRRNSAIQSFSFVLMLVTVYMAEDLNEYFAHNHRLFTKHQYFDSSGLFISVIMSGPLLLASSFVVANWFYVSSQLMTQVKILQLQKRQRKQSVMVEQSNPSRTTESPESSRGDRKRRRAKKDE